MVGYCDPPKHSRFKPGQSGNPAGGPKGPRRKAGRIRSKFLDQVISCKIGGKSFKGKRREAIVKIAAIWAISKVVPGSKARGADERDRLPRPNFALQQLLMKLAKQEREIEQQIDRENPLFLIVAFPSRPDAVSCVEDAADVAGFGIKAYHKRKSARVLLETWVIEEGLARLGDHRLTRAEQEQILAAARFPKKVQWPSWWEPDLRERGRGWRAPPVAQNIAPPKPSETIRMGFMDYWKASEGERLYREEVAYARDYASWSAEDQELLLKPWERPGRPRRDGQLNPESDDTNDS